MTTVMMRMLMVIIVDSHHHHHRQTKSNNDVSLMKCWGVSHVIAWFQLREFLLIILK